MIKIHRDLGKRNVVWKGNKVCFNTDTVGCSM